MEKSLVPMKKRGWYMKATDGFLDAMSEASKGLGLNKTEVVEAALALAFPAYFVGVVPQESTRQNTRAKNFDDHRETKNAGGPSDSSTVASPEPASCFGEGEGSAASCSADPAAGNRDANSEDLAAEKSREARPR